MRLAFKIAVRFLKYTKVQTIIIFLGIAVGVSIQVFIGTLIEGVQNNLINKTIGSSSQITIASKNDDKAIASWESKVTKIKELKNEVKGISAAADFPAFVKIYGKEKTYPILLRGFNFEDADTIYKINNNIICGKEPEFDNEVLMGTDLQKESGAKLGDTVTIFTPQGIKRDVIITGFYDLKSSNINKSWILTTMKTVQDTFNFGDKATSIEMQVKDVFNVDGVLTDIKDKLKDNNLKITNWKETNASLLSALSGHTVSSVMIQVFVLISVILGIASVLAITVLQKSKQIGILKAMGIKDRISSLIFLAEGLILGVIGSIMGILLGLTWMYFFTRFARNQDGTPIISLYVNYKFIMFSALIATLSACIAAIIPAKNSSRLDPVDVIRNG